MTEPVGVGVKSRDLTRVRSVPSVVPIPQEPTGCRASEPEKPSLTERLSVPATHLTRARRGLPPTHHHFRLLRRIVRCYEARTITMGA
jgi:hypothetical protein